MGGNALDKSVVQTRRFQREEYFDLVNRLLPKLKELLQTECVVLEAFGQKDSFGDMDVLVQIGGKYNVQEMIELIKHHLKPPPNDTFKNDNVFSFDHEELQIDLIFTRPEDMQISFNFSKFGDLGNLVGKILRKFDLKYGFDGLRFVYRTSEERVLGEIHLTKDIGEILRLAGLSYARWKNGFETAEQVFNFVASSRYFDPDSFKLENLNNINRKRNKKRKMYGDFVKYCEEKKFESRYTFNPDKTVYRDMIEEAFPGFYEKLKELEDKEAYLKNLREKFNGDMVMQEFPELKGPELGKALGGFKKSFVDFDKFLENHSAEEIMIGFKMFMNHIKIKEEEK